jgi:hypothetical protein
MTSLSILIGSQFIISIIFTFHVEFLCFEAEGESLPWSPYGRNGRKNRVTIFLNGQFIIVYTYFQF